MPERVIFVDLDETLIYYFSGVMDFERAVEMTERQIARAHGEFETAHTTLLREKLASRTRSRNGYRAALPIGSSGERVGVRPGAREALVEMGDLGQVHVFTAADPEYAENMLEVAGLRGLFGSVFSMRDYDIEDHLAWAHNARWVLIDDKKASAKLRVLGSRDPANDPRLIEVEPFTDGWLETKPLTNYVEQVAAALNVRENRPPAKHYDNLDAHLDSHDIQDASPLLYRVLRGTSALDKE